MEKVVFNKINIYLFALLFNSIILSNSLPNREIIILLETIDYETIDKTLEAPNIYRYPEISHPVGLGGTSISLLIALYQQASPIIVNKSLIKNIIDHQNLFSDCLNLDRKSLHGKYYKYNRFRGRLTLDKFRKSCQLTNNLTSEVNKMLGNLIKNGTNNFDQILNQIINYPKFQCNSYPEIQNAIANKSYTKSLNLEMSMFILCSWIDFDKDWEIKQVNEDIFLLIPKNYVQNLGLVLPRKSQQIPQNYPAKFTDLELELGLKVDHMKTVNRRFFEKKFPSNPTQISFVTSLEQIFLTIDNIKTLAHKKVLKHIWSIHMSGHGLNLCSELDILPQLYKLENFYKSQLTPHKNFKKTNSLNLSKKDQNAIYLKKLRKLNHEIKKAEDRKNLNNKIDQAMINSLSINDFRDTLKFFNNKIETAFLYYFSCFSAGPNLIEPYQENDKPLILNYMVMTGTPAENESLQEFPFINIPPYFAPKDEFIFEPIDISQINIENKKLSMTTPLRFDHFFKLLRKGAHHDLKNLILIPYSLHPHVDQFGKIIPRRIANIPLVRFAYTNHFQPIPNDDSSVILDIKNSRSISVDKNTGLIYSDYISGKVTLNKLGKDQEIPKLISMIPGFALHIFEDVKSSTLNLKEVVNSFLTFPELGSSKIFWIKKLNCTTSNGLNKRNELFNDVIILRNVFNSNTLALCSDVDPLSLENCAYFSTTINRESKLTWKGPFIDDYNSKILPCNESEHKKECINCFPHAARFLSPVLQSM